MAFGKILLTVSTLIVMMMLVVVVFAFPGHPSLTRSQGGRKLVEDTATTTPTKQDFEVMFFDKGKGASSSSSSKVVEVVEDSAREVPTGPDPLHHNNKPIKP